ncbi:sunset domain-containing protein [Tessaracoccus terricola]
MNKTRELKKAAADAAANTADAGQKALDEGVARASEFLGEAQKVAAGIIDEAQKRAVPAAKDAGVRAADFASKKLDSWEPHIRDALDKVAPAVEAAKDKVSDDLLPRLQTMLHDVAEHPALVEASKRGEAAAQALKGELEPKKKGGKLKAFGKVVAIGAIVVGAVAAVRHFLTPKDDGWTAHEPSKAYVNNNDTFATAARLREEDATPSTATDAPTDGSPSDEAPASEETEAAFEAPVEDSTDAAEATEYGEGAYVGSNPPEGFVIKGNERSKKYHLAGSGGYERTIAEVWFNSEEAAQAAGFTKAQR